MNPGEIGTFRFKIKPSVKGVYSEYFQLVIENTGWIEGSIVRWDISVSGSAAVGSIDLTADAAINKKAAAVITSAKKEILSATTTPNTNIQISNTEKPFRVRISYGDDNSTITAD